MNRGAVPWSALITFLVSACCLCDQHCSTAQHLSSGWCPSRGQRCSPIQHLLSVRLVGQRSVDCLPGEDCRAASARMREPGEVLEKRLRSVSHGFTISTFYRSIPVALVFSARAAKILSPRPAYCPSDQGSAARLATPLTHLRSVKEVFHFRALYFCFRGYQEASMIHTHTFRFRSVIEACTFSEVQQRREGSAVHTVYEVLEKRQGSVCPCRMRKEG